MTGTCKLNNKSMRNLRHDQVYQCAILDLAMLGVISKAQCEMLMGSGIPSNIILPDLTSKLLEEPKAEKKTSKKVVETVAEEVEE